MKNSLKNSHVVDEDLLQLYRFESVHNSPDEKALADWLEQWFKERNIDVTRDGDNFYKLDVFDTPILSAHLDQVKTNGKVEHLYLAIDGKIVGYNNKWQQTSLGGDDKNGVWIILKALEELNGNVNFIISAGEEVGCVGIKLLDSHDVLKLIDTLGTTYCMVLDRRGNNDVLKGGGGTTYCSTLAQNICNFLGEMSVTTGSLSDTATICEYCESINMSVAYDDPHSAKETTNWDRLIEIKDNVIKIIKEMVHYPTPPSVYKSSTTTYSSYSSYFGSSKKSSKKKGLDYDEDEYWYGRY